MALNFPINPTIGQVYTVGSESWQWNGHCWVVAASTSTYAPVAISQFAPGAPIAGDLWWNNQTGMLCLYYADVDGSQWVAATQVPDIIATVSSAQVVTAFLESLSPYANITAAVAAGVNTGELFRIDGAAGVSAIRAVSSYDSGGGSTTVASLVTLSGVAADSDDLGTFTGSPVIPANSTVKAALQALDTSLGTNNVSTAAVVTLSGVPTDSTNLGTFAAGTLITANSTIKAALQEIDIFAGDVAVSTSALIQLSGLPGNTYDLGTFTGTIIADNSSVKGALQQLETKAETAVYGAAGAGSQIQFNQAGAFTGSTDLTFNTGTKELTVAGPIVSDSVTGTDTAFKTETGGVAFTTILNNGTASFAGEVTTSNRITHQRASASSVAVRFSPDAGSTFPATIEAGGKANLPNVNFNVNYANKAAAPVGALGDVAVIGGILCFRDGTDWKEIALGSAPA